METLNFKLNNNYDEDITKEILNLYHNRYLPYYQSALFVYPRKSNLLQKIKYFIKVLLLKEQNLKSRGLLLLHNIRIDSHRFIVQGALSLLFEGGNNK